MQIRLVEQSARGTAGQVVVLLEDHIGALDKLRADEEQVREYRAANTGSTLKHVDTYDPEARVIRRTTVSEVG